MSLRVRLLLVVALTVSIVVLAVVFFEVRSFAGTLENGLIDDARLAARAVADEVAARPALLDPEVLRETLVDLAEANPVVRTLSVVGVGDSGQPVVVASTQAEERAEVLPIARQALDRQEVVLERRDLRVICATPLAASPRPMAAVTTVSLVSVERARTMGLAIAFGVAIPVIVIATLLIDIATRQLIHRPLTAIRDTMKAAARGDLVQRARTYRDDELGAVAGGLNHMLDELEQLYASLHERVRASTDELRLRNAQLDETYRQLLTQREALARSERLAAVGHLAATVAHQTGTPLNLISGYVQMVRDDPRTDTLTKQRLGVVDAQIGQITGILRSLLDQVRQPLRPELVSLGPLVSRLCELAAPRLNAANVRVRLDIADGLPGVLVDAVQLELALFALIGNSADAMPDGGTLSITVRQQGAGVVLDVSDTGPGVPDDMIDRVFDPWVTSKAAGQGTGLGLSVVRDVVRGSGGQIGVRNRPDGGATFTLSFPVAKPTATVVH